MFLKNSHSETYICRKCGKIQIINLGSHGMAIRAMYGIPKEWIHVSLMKDEGIFCSKKCARKWIKEND